MRISNQNLMRYNHDSLKSNMKPIQTSDYSQDNFKSHLQAIEDIDNRIANPNQQFNHYNGILDDIKDEVQKPNIINNSVEIRKGDVFSLGEYQGRKIIAKRKDNGYLFSSNGGGAIKYTGSRVTARQERIANIVGSFTKEQHQAAGRTTAVLSSLVLVADGKESVNFFNEKFSSTEYNDIDVKKEISRIGLNVNDIFTVNGKKFKFDEGNLVNL